MRRSQADVDVNRENVVRAASRLFRELGLEQTTVIEVMKAAGLTHGAFYTYYDSKEDLAETALDRAFRESVARWTVQPPSGDALAPVLDSYLSNSHVNAPGTGCVVAALGGELARSSPAIRKVGQKGVERMVDRIVEIVPGGSLSNRQNKADAITATLIGALIMARLQDDDARVAEILDAATSAVRTVSRAT